MAYNHIGKGAPNPRKRGRVLKPHVLTPVSGPILFPSLFQEELVRTLGLCDLKKGEHRG